MLVPDKLWSAGDPPREVAPEPAPEPGYAVNGGGGASDATRAALPATTQPLPGLRESGNSVRDIYRAASPAVVSVRTSGGQGTGFLVERDGTIVTNAHVVGTAGSAQVSFGDDGRTVSATIVGTDPSHVHG